MSTLYVRGFPDELHRKVRARATSKHRSLSAEVIVLVEEGIKSEDAWEQYSQALDRVAQRRRSSPRSSNSLELLREDRAR